MQNIGNDNAKGTDVIGEPLYDAFTSPLAPPALPSTVAGAMASTDALSSALERLCSVDQSSVRIGYDAVGSLPTISLGGMELGQGHYTSPSDKARFNGDLARGNKTRRVSTKTIFINSPTTCPACGKSFIGNVYHTAGHKCAMHMKHSVACRTALENEPSAPPIPPVPVPMPMSPMRKLTMHVWDAHSRVPSHKPADVALSGSAPSSLAVSADVGTDDAVNGSTMPTNQCRRYKWFGDKMKRASDEKKDASALIVREKIASEAFSHFTGGNLPRARSASSCTSAVPRPISTQSPRPLSGPVLYVTHLPPELNAADVETLFAPFGTLKAVELLMDMSASKGICVVAYDTTEAAMAAVNAMNGLRIGPKRLKVQYSTESAISSKK